MKISYHTFKTNYRMIFAGVLLIASWMYAFSGESKNLLARWDSEDYSYCYLIPFIFLYLLYEKRDKLLASPRGSVWLGYTGLAFAAVLFLAGVLGSIEGFVYFSFWLIIASIAVLVFGKEALGDLGFPLLILLFAIPVPPFLSSLLTFQLKLLSTDLAIKILHALGVSAFQEGNLIDLGVVKMQVVDACSGLRYLFPTVLLALLTGHFFNKRFVDRAALVILSVPVSVVVNSLRIVAVGILSVQVSTSFAEEGFLHDFSGLIIFLLTAAFLLSLSSLLRRIPAREKPAKVEGLREDRDPDCIRSGRYAQTSLHVLVFAAVFVLLHLTQTYFISNQVNPQRKSFTDFPLSIENWEGKREYLEKALLDSLWADDYVLAKFLDSKSPARLNLLIAYYGAQTTYHTAHAPTSCLVGSGWNMTGSRILSLSTETGRNFQVQQMVMEKDGQKLLANFWFQQRGRIITSEFLNKFYLFWDAFSRSRSDGALIRIELVMPPDVSIDDAQRQLDIFALELKKILGPYIPD